MMIFVSDSVYSKVKVSVIKSYIKSMSFLLGDYYIKIFIAMDRRWF